MEKLTVKQRRFIEAYDGNATEAAIKAGYSQKTAAVVGAENLTKPYIAQAIQEREEKEARSRIATRQKRQEYWTKVMLDESQPIMARLRASELLGKSEGDFLERHEITGQNGGPVKVLDMAAMSEEQLMLILQARDISRPQRGCPYLLKFAAAGGAKRTNNAALGHKWEKAIYNAAGEGGWLGRSGWASTRPPSPVCFYPVAQGVIHACLPALTHALESGQDIIVKTDSR
ncbi:MAG: terminase small subunit [Desulfobulbaceae bacterium]|jgi:phage terminase small subunit|nr:terminase small subunit [Desulfobulbaceae bacterium]